MVEPKRIFNMDETAFFFLNPKGNKVLAAKDEKSVYQQVNSDEKECFTVLLGGNAAGQVLPPMVVALFPNATHLLQPMDVAFSEA